MSRWSNQLIDAMPTPGQVAADQRAAAVAAVSGRLASIVASYAELAEQQTAEHPDTMADLGEHTRRYGKWTIDPVTEALPAGPMKRSSGQPPVTGSRERPAPVDLDVLGLTGPANANSVLVLATTPWPKDQTGHLAVASELDFWACDWASRRGEQPPVPQVPQLCAWLDVRLEWAHDEFPAWGEMAAALDRVARALYGTLTPRKVRSVPVSAPCPRDGCEGVLGRREDGWVECGDGECGRILKPSEYTDWAIATIHRVANGGWGITAQEIQIVTGWPAGTVRRVLHEYGITKTGPEARRTLYSREEFEVARPKIEAKRQARSEREARAA